MDDVIERMARAVIAKSRPFWPARFDREYRKQIERESLQICINELRRALRAVHDTHRLVPLSATLEMKRIGEAAAAQEPGAGIEWEYMVNAAPDYTENDDE